MGEIRVTTRDDWEEAWEYAAELLEADRLMGLAHHVTVKEVKIPKGKGRYIRTWGIFLLDPPIEGD